MWILARFCYGKVVTRFSQPADKRARHGVEVHAVPVVEEGAPALEEELELIRIDLKDRIEKMK